MISNTFPPQIKLSRPSDNKKCFVCKAFSLATTKVISWAKDPITRDKFANDWFSGLITLCRNLYTE